MGLLKAVQSEVTLGLDDQIVIKHYLQLHTPPSS